MSVLKAVLVFLWAMLISKARLAIENLALSQQLAVCRQSIKRPKLRPRDRIFWAFAGLSKIKVCFSTPNLSAPAVRWFNSDFSMSRIRFSGGTRFNITGCPQKRPGLQTCNPGISSSLLVHYVSATKTKITISRRIVPAGQQEYSRSPPIEPVAFLTRRTTRV
jgi:hypothetical protein